MEHILWRSDLPRPRPLVPYLCEEVQYAICDRVENLRIWPALMRWDQSQEVPITSAAARCQAWLYFGLLRILMLMKGESFNPDLFVMTVHGRKVVSSAGIHLLIQKVSGKAFACHQEKKETAQTRSGQRLLDELQALLPDAVEWIIRVVQKYEEDNGACNLWNFEVYNVFLSTLLLVEGICDAAIGKCSVRGAGILHRCKPLVRLFCNTTRTLHESYKELGHCPSLFTRINLSLSTACQSMALPAETIFDHSRCETDSCKSYNVNHETYLPRHTQGCDRCSLLRIDADFLCNLIRKDSIPLVRSTLTPNGEVYVDIVDGTDIVDYVAISHLWAGGLGNMKENAHYHCQFKQIHLDLMTLRRSWLPHSTTVTPVYYWLDSLCIPVAIQMLRIRAINTMAHIYAGSSSVLVIDPTLYRFSTADTSLRELDLAVLCSAWMARSWTLQEGALAVKIVFRFADKPISFEQLKIVGGHSRRTSIQSLWLWDVDRIIPRSYDDLTIDPLLGFSSTIGLNFNRRRTKENQDSVTTETAYSNYIKFVKVWNELSRRTTSESADIGAILGALIDRSASEVLSLDEHARMQALLRTQTMLPTDLLFAPVDPKSVTWSPRPPGGGQQSYSFQFTDDVMEFLPSGIFRIDCLKSVQALRSRGPLSLPVETCIQMPLSLMSCHIKFENRPCEVAETIAQDIVLLLNKPSYSKQDYSNGKCFVLIKATDEGFYLRYDRSFVYKHFDREKEHHHTKLGSQSHALDFVEIGHVSATCPLFVDMLVEWPQLRWSRSQFYPFTDISRQVASWLYLFDGVFLGLTFMTYTVAISQFLSAIKIPTYPGTPLMIPIATLAFIAARNYLSNIEYLYFQKLANSDLQPRWAASFSMQESVSKLDSESPRYLWTATFYTILLVATYVPTVIMFVQLPAVQTVWDQGFGWSVISAVFAESLLDVDSGGNLRPWYTFVARNACRTIFAELLIRAVVMSTVDLKRFFHDHTRLQGLEIGPSDQTDERFSAKFGILNLLYCFIYVPGAILFITLGWVNAIVSGTFKLNGKGGWNKLFQIFLLIYSTKNIFDLVILVYGPKLRSLTASTKGLLKTAGSRSANLFSRHQGRRTDSEIELFAVQRAGQPTD